MQQEDDLGAPAKIMRSGRAVNIFILVIHVYVYCYPSVNAWHLNLGIIDRILMNFNRTTGIFDYILWTKSMIVLLLAISCMGTAGVRGEKITWRCIWAVPTVGAVLFLMSWWLLELPLPHEAIAALYVITLAAGYLCLPTAGLWINRLYRHNLTKDIFNIEGEPFTQETRLMENGYFVNLSTRLQYGGKLNNGWINVVDPFRVIIVLGIPDSGKSYAMVNNYIKQMIPKGFSVYIYDYKFGDLSTITYNTLLHNTDKCKVKPYFYAISFGDPHRLHRCNPVNPEFMADIPDAYEASYTIMFNLNHAWIEKQGNFFVESPIILLTATIQYPKIFKGGIYYMLSHTMELLSKSYSDLLIILTPYPGLESYLSSFMDTWKGGAQNQFQGQTVSVKIPFTRMISPQLYWVITGNDFSLGTNNPEEPKTLCVGNNPGRQSICSAVFGLYNSRIVKLINEKGQFRGMVIIDELPIVYFRGLDNLITTARSDKVAVCPGFQDSSQLSRNYGEKESRVIQSTVGNIFSSQVVDETAKTLPKRFGKIPRKRQSMFVNRQDVSTSTDAQLDSLIPTSKISSLSQGMSVGSVPDDFGEEIDQKIFHAEIIVGHVEVSAGEKVYKKVLIINTFKDSEGNDITFQQIQRSYDQIKADAQAIINDEMGRIKNDLELCERLGIKSVEEERRKAEWIQNDK